MTLFTLGGSIDKTYSLEASDFVVGAPLAPEMLKEAGYTGPFEVVEIARKDSLELNDEDRRRLFDAVAACGDRHIVVTHGTDTMAESARALSSIAGKTIVFTGAMQPGAFKVTDATFNVGFAVAAAKLLPPGVYVAMNGHVFDPFRVKKDFDLRAFVETDEAH